MSDSPAVTLDPAAPGEAGVLSNLLELYAHDLSEIFFLEFGADGRFGYEKLPLYWSETERRFRSSAVPPTSSTDIRRDTMTIPGPVFDQVNLVVRDMDATLAFYRRLGLTIPAPPNWPPGSAARHAEVAMPSGVRFELDNHEMARIWHAGWAESSDGARAVLGFSLASRQEVDARYAELTAAGYAGRQPPTDAFWGARFAIVRDPDGNDVGLMSPVDTAKRFTPRA